MAKVIGNAVKPGNVVDFDGVLWLAVKAVAVKPGKGGAFNQVELKNISDGRKLNHRFRADETVEIARLEQIEHQYLYLEGDAHIFMNVSTYDQVSLSNNFIGEQSAFLQPNMMVNIEMHEEKPITITLPKHITLEIIEADPVVKGQTAASSYKPAKLENGLRIMVPPFVAAGERIIVDTAEISYVRRAD